MHPCVWVNSLHFYQIAFYQFQNKSFNVPISGLEFAWTEYKVRVQMISDGDQRNYPKMGDKLTVHYTGWTASNGAKFESSLETKPLKFTFGEGEVTKIMIIRNNSKQKSTNLTPFYKIMMPQTSFF